MKYVIPLILIVAGLAIACIGLKRVMHAKESSDWPKAEGVVLESEIKETSGARKSNNKRSRKRYSANVIYEFEVSGKKYNGNRVAYGDQGYKDPRKAVSILERYPKGKKIQVTYMSGDPSECLLETGLKDQAWYMPLFGIGLLIIGAVNLSRKSVDQKQKKSAHTTPEPP